MVFLTILLGLLPSFLMVGLGGLVRKRLSANAWQGLDKLNFEILFPALLFVSAAARPIQLGDVIRMAPAVWGILTLGLLLGYGVRRFGPELFLDFAGAWQTAWRFNSAIGIVAITTLEDGNAAQMAVAIGLAVPVANVFAVSALSRGGSLGALDSAKKVLLNPFLLASVAGVIVGLTGVKIPPPILAPLQMLAAAAIPIALISVGATMNWGALAILDRFSAAMNAVKLVALPAVTLGLCLAVGVRPDLASRAGCIRRIADRFCGACPCRRLWRRSGTGGDLGCTIDLARRCDAAVLDHTGCCSFVISVGAFVSMPSPKPMITPQLSGPRPIPA